MDHPQKKINTKKQNTNFYGSPAKVGGSSIIKQIA